MKQANEIHELRREFSALSSVTLLLHPFFFSTSPHFNILVNLVEESASCTRVCVCFKYYHDMKQKPCRLPSVITLVTWYHLQVILATLWQHSRTELNVVCVQGCYLLFLILSATRSHSFPCFCFFFLGGGVYIICWKR